MCSISGPNHTKLQRPEQDVRRVALDALDRWFFTVLDGMSYLLVLPNRLRDDDSWSCDPDDGHSRMAYLPIFPVVPADVRPMPDADEMWSVRFSSFRAGGSSAGRLPSRNASGETCPGDLDDEMKVEPYQRQQPGRPGRAVSDN